MKSILIVGKVNVNRWWLEDWHPVDVHSNNMDDLIAFDYSYITIVNLFLFWVDPWFLSQDLNEYCSQNMSHDLSHDPSR